ncbi:MAG: mechanosensitive ion channel [Rhodospirillales bacterium]|nr:mechanosensitive ion channel [Rhodospirillales bacterium]
MASRGAAARGRAIASAFALVLAATILVIGSFATGPTLAAEGVVTADELGDLLAAIEDETERSKLADRLRALIAVTGEEKAVEQPGGWGARFVTGLSEGIGNTGNQLVALARSVSDVPAFAEWLRQQMSEPDARAFWSWLAWRLAIVLVAGLITERLVRAALSRSRRALENREDEGWTVRAASLLARTVLELIPIAAFMGAAFAAMALVREEPKAHLVTLAAVNAYLAFRVVMVAARLVLVPAVPALRFAPVSNETANYLVIWVRRFAVVALAGYFLAQATVLAGMPAAIGGGLAKLLGLVLAAMVSIFILQNRDGVAAWLRGGDAEDRGSKGIGRLRHRLADIWHIAAIAYVLGVFGVGALDVEGGFAFLLRATVATVAVLTAAHVATSFLGRVVRRGFAVGEDAKSRFPGLEARANRYLPVLNLVLRGVVYAAAVLALLEGWGLDTFGWLNSPLGGRVIGSGLTIAIALAATLVVWEAASSAVERYFGETDAEGKLIERGARARTLLPLFRNVLFIVLAVIVTLVVLSELGVNIAPLLAGAGVIGLAVGFGSQKLVQDVINGAFILFEDSIAVGDVVSAGGHAGVVESLNIRSIRLRNLSGHVHTIPFSTVDTVTNLTKEFSYSVFEIGIAYREDTDAVTEVLREIGTEMQTDPEFGPLILEPLDVMGVDKFDDSAVVIKARFKTAPIKQWTVGREFNRRMKKRFDALGIEIPFPHQTLYFGEDKQGRAPAVRVALEGPDASEHPHHDQAPKEDR